MLRESNQQGWTTKKQVEDLIIKMSGKHYTISTYTMYSSQVGF
jgi:hypothetical protein